MDLPFYYRTASGTYLGREQAGAKGDGIVFRIACLSGRGYTERGCTMKRCTVWQEEKQRYELSGDLVFENGWYRGEPVQRLGRF